MSFDTTKINKQRQNLKDREEIWLFGYGSLIYKVDFPFLQKLPATISGWTRRFWQGSHDHRGTPDKPGRVVTLIESVDEECSGMAYRVSHDVFEHLDHREKNGYLRYDVDLTFSDKTIKSGLVYIAPENNLAYLGPASEQSIAQHIHQSHGPSGSNRDYALQLANALKTMGVNDPHVFEIEHYLLQYKLSHN